MKVELAHQFDMKNFRLGIKIAISSKDYLLSLFKYIADILYQARLMDIWTVDTPLKLNTRYSPIDGTLLFDPTLYQTLVGSLIYLTITRPNIVYIVHIVNEFLTHQFDMKNLGPLHNFVSIKVALSSKGYLLSQSKYIADILHQD